MDPSGARADDINDLPVVLCDAVDSLAVHNGVARLRLSRLNADGGLEPALELLAPTPVVSQIIAALQMLKL